MTRKSPPKKVTTVHAHPRRVPVSKRNPDGVTIVDQHLRRLKGTYLDVAEIQEVLRNYDRTQLRYPAKNKLPQYPNADKYDDLIALWTDYFNQKLAARSPLDPDVVKALIGSESDFQIDPPGNKVATGIAQITRSTLAILQDPKGEAKEFIFQNIRQKDLLDPNIAIPMAVRWLYRKKALADHKLGREANHEEVILEYKGLLKSSSAYKENAIQHYRENYAFLKAR